MQTDTKNFGETPVLTAETASFAASKSHCLAGAGILAMALCEACYVDQAASEDNVRVTVINTSRQGATALIDDQTSSVFKPGYVVYYYTSVHNRAGRASAYTVHTPQYFGWNEFDKAERLYAHKVKLIDKGIAPDYFVSDADLVTT